VTKLKANYLSLTGYRLPTEAEMEYAIRAGAGSSRYYGETDELLGNYAWYAKNSGDRPQRVGLKKPNDLGLFDVQGGCFTWCQDAIGAYPSAEGGEAVEDQEVPKDQSGIESTVGRVLRGGAFHNQPSILRSSSRLDNVPANRDFSLGFRVARTPD
jgi:formylglycine-generating enzyme required for sulfatase activity